MDQGAPGLTPPQHEEALRQAAVAAADVRPGACIYPELPSLDPAPPPPRLAKQLHPGWVAARAGSLKPELGALWSAEEQQPGVCSTGPVALYRRPRAREVVEAMLEL